MTLKASTIDHEEEESEDEDINLISKKFIKYIRLEKIKGRRSQSKKESLSAKKKKKTTMESTYSESDKDSMEEDCNNKLSTCTLWIWKTMKRR